MTHRFDNPKIITTIPRKPPHPRGHRQWLVIDKPREKEVEAA